MINMIDMTNIKYRVNYLIIIKNLSSIKKYAFTIIDIDGIEEIEH